MTQAWERGAVYGYMSVDYSYSDSGHCLYLPEQGQQQLSSQLWTCSVNPERERVQAWRWQVTRIYHTSGVNYRKVPEILWIGDQGWDEVPDSCQWSWKGEQCPQALEKLGTARLHCLHSFTTPPGSFPHQSFLHTPPCGLVAPPCSSPFYLARTLLSPWKLKKIHFTYSSLSKNSISLSVLLMI